MPNNSPTAVATVSATELTLPDNELTYDLSGSYDTDKDGNHVQRDFKYSVKVDDEEVSTDVSGTIAIEEGQHKLSMTVYDKRGASGTVVEDILVKLPIPPKPKITFGIKWAKESIDDQIRLCKDLGVTWMRQAVELENYSKGMRFNAIDKALDAGLKLLLNVNWQSGGTQRKFPTDMPLYEDKNDAFDNTYLDAKDLIIKICENEPTTDSFYNDTINNYLTELTSFVKVSKANGFKTADGCIFVEWINAIVSGGKLRANGLDNQTMVNAYATIDLDYVNMHWVTKGNVIPDLAKAANYVRNLTGKPVISNEHHYENSSADTVARCLQAAIDAEILIISPWSASGTQGDPFVTNGELNDKGLAYQSIIKSNS